MKRIIKRQDKEYFVFGENTRHYPNPPKLSDVEIINLAITAESLQIDSENLLWSKLETDYPNLFKDLPHRTRFNARRKLLRKIIVNILADISDILAAHSEFLIIDSMPIPICKLAREHTSKICRDHTIDEVIANKGFSTSIKSYFIDYKFHLITNESGVYRDLLITPASHHDNSYLKLLNARDYHLKGMNLIGDRGYLGKDTQLRLFADLGLKLNIPYRRDQKGYKEYPYKLKIIRKKIETVFSQYCDEFIIRRNYAKRFNDFEIRLLTKVTAKTVKQYINFLNNRPINQTKHSLAA